MVLHLTHVTVFLQWVELLPDNWLLAANNQYFYLFDLDIVPKTTARWPEIGTFHPCTKFRVNPAPTAKAFRFADSTRVIYKIKDGSKLEAITFPLIDPRNASIVKLHDELPEKRCLEFGEKDAIFVDEQGKLSVLGYSWLGRKVKKWSSPKSVDVTSRLLCSFTDRNSGSIVLGLGRGADFTAVVF